jgi:xylulokinase
MRDDPRSKVTGVRDASLEFRGDCVIGVDIGTSSIKVVAVDANGAVLATVQVPHVVTMPAPNRFEQDAELVWWQGTAGVLNTLTGHEALAGRPVAAVCVSGMGPCLVVTGDDGIPLRPGILYGIDMRASEEIELLGQRFGHDIVARRCGSQLTSQAVGPKLLWLQRHEPEIWARATHWFSTGSFVVQRLTGANVIDHHTASQCVPLYDLATRDWAFDWAPAVVGSMELPDLAWPGEVVGQVTESAFAATGLPAGTPVLAGTVDAWAEAHSVGVREPGDLMLMYGSTMFLVGISPGVDPVPGLWHTAGIHPGLETLAAGMATSGLLIDWLARTTNRAVAELIDAAADVPAGADGLIALPYFAGERSPLFDPDARGMFAGLTLSHTPGHLMRALLEGIAMGVRHNLEAFGGRAAADSWRTVAVGGGAVSRLWLQIVSDVTGYRQHVPQRVVGAAYGAAGLAAAAAGLVSSETDWTEIVDTIEPDLSFTELYENRYRAFRELYVRTRDITH